MKSIYTEFNNSGLLFDKTTQNLSALPYDYNDVRIKVNEFVTVATYNDIITKLQYNLLYLYRACNIADFNLFNTYEFSLSGKDDNTFTFYTAENSYYNIKNAILSGVSDAVFINTEFTGNNLNYLICLNKTNIPVLALTKEYGGLYFTNTLVGSISSNVQYGNLIDIENTGDNNLYVVDDLYNNIYHYDLTNLSLNENIFNKRLVLKKIIGGKGDVISRNKFGKIKNLTANNNIVIVQDYENKCFKVFDKNLNWINTCVFVKMFDKIGSFSSLLLSDDGVFLCAKNKSIYKFVLQNNEISFEKEYNVSSYFAEEENIKSLKFFNTNKNIIYIVTNKSVKKVWITRLDFIIGQYFLKNENILWFTNTQVQDDYDRLAVYSLSGNELENFSLYKDNLSLNSLLENNKFQIFSLEEDLILKKDEYVQNWVILKNLKKIYTNILLLIKNIKYRYEEESTDKYYPIIKRKIYNTNLLGFFNTIKFDTDFNVGINEIFQGDVLNRCITQIIDLQKIIILNLINNKNTLTFNSPEPEKIRQDIKKYFYYVDDSLVLSPNPVSLDIFEALAPGPGIVTSLGGAPFEGIEGISITEGINI